MASPSHDNKIASYYNDSSTDEHYSALWGEGNIHFGYFGDDIDAIISSWTNNPQNTPIPSYPIAAARSSDRLMTFGGINAQSTVLDLGCGYGKTALSLSQRRHCRLVMGLDLS